MVRMKIQVFHGGKKKKRKNSLTLYEGNGKPESISTQFK